MVGVTVLDYPNLPDRAAGVCPEQDRDGTAVGGLTPAVKPAQPQPNLEVEMFVQMFSAFSDGVLPNPPRGMAPASAGP